VRNLGAVNGTVAVLLIVYAVVSAFPPAELIRLALTALLTSVPVALPATFTLSAAHAAQAQALARRGEPPPHWWTPLLSSAGSGKVSNGPGASSIYR